MDDEWPALVRKGYPGGGVKFAVWTNRAAEQSRIAARQDQGD